MILITMILLLNHSAFYYDGKVSYTGGKLIVNGTETKEITNQFGGNPGGDRRGEMMPNEMPQENQQGGERKIMR